MQNKFFIVAAVLFQVMILGGMFLKAFFPLFMGEEIRLKTVPKDPRDWLRGNYVVLNYDFNTLNLRNISHNIDTSYQYRFGDVLYLEMAEKEGFYVPVGLWKEIPETSNKVMRVIVESYNVGYNYINLNAGIESYFTNPEKAKEIEDAMRGTNWWEQPTAQPDSTTNSAIADSVQLSTQDSIQLAIENMTDSLEMEINNNLTENRDLTEVIVLVKVTKDGFARIKDVLYPKPKSKKE
ncbi:MAG: hypothetical protein OHK0038_03250 [Flammeovirgaceae bacterium]